MKWIFASLAILFSVFASTVLRAEDAGTEAEAQKKGVRYKTGKDINFEELLIQGQLKRPEITVVTGNTGQGTDGLLRLRENFLDRITDDFGEEVP